MKKKLYVTLSFLCCFSIVIVLLIYVNNKQLKPSYENTDSTSVDKDINNQDKVETDNITPQDPIIVDNDGKGQEEHSKNDTPINNPNSEKPKEDSSPAIQPSTPNNESSITPTTPSTPNQSTTPIIPDDNPIDETPNQGKEEEIITNNENDPDPTHPLYSRHLGHIDFKMENFDNDKDKTFNACMDKGFEINFAHPVEIVSFSCVEVYSKTQKFLGYYLELTCIEKCQNDFKQP